MTFNVTGNTNAALFSIAPAISSAGVLDVHGGAERERDGDDHRALQDNGGTARRRRRHVRPTDLHDHDHGR